MRPEFHGGSVFVTGAYGLLGSRLVKALVQRGAHVTVLKRDGVLISALILDGTERRVDVVRGDISDAPLIERIMNEYEVETVFHLAAQTIVGIANQAPLSTFESNVRGTWTVLEACRHRGVARIVVAASDKAYGPQPDLPYREDQALLPRFPYDVSKAATDMIARSYWHTFGLPVAVTRLANIYGGGDFNLSRLVPECTLAAIAGRRPVIRSDGSLQRDYLYVEDAVEAYLAIAELLASGRGFGEAFNAGGGKPYSVLEVAELTCRAAGTGVAPDVRGTGPPEGEIPCQWLDSSKLASISGWAPTVDLEAGLRRTVTWYREHLAHIERLRGTSVP
jgi:CDP-glucose 4,6-dehydratase